MNDRIFSGVEREFDVFHWHGDTFELPQGAVHLAESDLCKNQAFRFGDNVYAFQFHLEIDHPTIESWITTYDDELRSLREEIDPEKILFDTEMKMFKYQRIAEGVFVNLLDAIG